jgi:multidrug efflux pump subunit AcrB
MQGEPAPPPVVLNDRAYTIRVRFPESTRASVASIANTLLVSSTGRTATLGSLTSMVNLSGQTEIQRDNLQRDVTVTARLEGLDLGSGIAAVQNAIAALHLPPGIRIEYGGGYREQQQSFHELVFVLLLAIVLVFIVLLFEFGSFAAPVAVLSSALLSTAGVFLALLITNTTFNISSFMGLIMVIGIVAKNGILLLDADERYRSADEAQPTDSADSPDFPDQQHRDIAHEAMMHAAQRRLRPIMMTAIAAVCGMLPLAFALGSGSEMLKPLAIAVIGGLLISVVLSLIVTPAVYYRLTRNRHA